ncbi:hypothetical protein O6H91_04G132500 [Diphasiastrum complanatum]|uniref:Uncharacterized protein n=1 Tax=Diphasiastrum complanatum TaxID=34168 RepID=A0ACC2E1Y5_DIPCM|nr:hypothetical protein O6H91_04G132500 [Diphasiastrum complanatum]
MALARPYQSFFLSRPNHALSPTSSGICTSSCHLNNALPILSSKNYARVQRKSVVFAAATDESSSNEAETDNGTRGKGLFSFVTDNPSSREAIQLPNEPAQDGNVGQMIYQIENKGRDFGSYVQAGDFSWFVRETGFKTSSNGAVVFLHGAPTQSYSYRDVIVKMAEIGYHCYAPDWLGFGFSEMPEPGDDFAYTEEAYHEEFDKLLTQLGLDSPFSLVTQNPSRLVKLGILNGPLTASATLPPVFQQLRLPFIGEFTCQNAVLAERFVEKGSPYVLELDDADVYRLPYLDSSAPGFSLLAATRKAPIKDLASRIANGFSESWNVPTIVLWGEADKYLPSSEAVNFANSNRDVINQVILDGAGHLPQEDWPEKVAEGLNSFLGSR